MKGHEGRTAVVTGANRGIGRAVAERLANEGFRIVLVARDARGGEEARSAIAARGGRVELVAGDLGSCRGVRAVAAALLEVSPRIDVLVHNAGLWPARRELNEDGVEKAFAVNHLAPFLLNHLLAGALGAAGDARVVQVSAGLYVMGRPDLARTPKGEDFHVIRTYATTKLFNLLLLGRYAEMLRPRGATVLAVHPGVIRTGLGDRGGILGGLLRLVKRAWKTPEAGAEPVVRLAIDPLLAGATGRYFHEREEATLGAAARDEALARAAWDQAAALTGLADRGMETDAAQATAR